MAESESGADKTEAPTSRRLEQSKEKGQIARSKDLATASVLIGAALCLMFFGRDLALGLNKISYACFTLDRNKIYDTKFMLGIMSIVVEGMAWPLLKIVITLFIISFLGSSILGGVNFSTEALMPKFNKLSPAAGLKKMFGMNALIELIKGIAKFVVVASAAYILLHANMNKILEISKDDVPHNIKVALEILSWIFLCLCLSILIIVAIDVPYQIWHHKDSLKMTKQEVKDEHKDTEGKPEVKGRQRQIQREVSQRRMFSELPNADVIVVNPEHYAVALKYDINRSSAPIVIAKGIDFVAFKIREVGKKYEIPIVTAPPLTRAIYHTTKIDSSIPEGLFIAVAQVLAYVYQLKQYKKGKGRRPKSIPYNQPIPPEYRY